MDKYGLEGPKYNLISDKGKKTVWKIRVHDDYAVLKKMPGSPARTAWLARAVDYLGRSGVKVSPLIPALDGSLSINLDDSAFILCRWLDGRQPELERNLEPILESMASFHQGGKGFEKRKTEHIRSHLGTWQDTYAKKRNMLEQVKKRAGEAMTDKFSLKCLKYIDYFIESAARAEEKIKSSCYDEWANRVEKKVCFCHQDFAPKNLRMLNGKVYVFDFDSITYDIPARDIRKLLNKMMKKKKWNKELPSKVYKTYRKYNSLSDSEWQVVLTDLMFPHLFCGIVSKYYWNRAQDWPKRKYLQRLDDMINVELDKEVILNDLI